jgi:hypothetical protein
MKMGGINKLCTILKYCHNMKKFTIVAIYLLIGFSSFAQKADLIEDCRNLILNTVRYGDSNPIYQPESDSINVRFQTTILNRERSTLIKDYNSDIELIFKWIYNNSTNEYDDSPDYRRLKMRRAICFATITLLSNFDKAYTFLEYSKVSLIESIERPDDELLENQYLGLMLIEIMLKTEENKIMKSDIDSIENYLNHRKDMIEKQNCQDMQNLIKKFRLIIK